MAHKIDVLSHGISVKYSEEDKAWSLSGTTTQNGAGGLFAGSLVNCPAPNNNLSFTNNGVYISIYNSGQVFYNGGASGSRLDPHKRDTYNNDYFGFLGFGFQILTDGTVIWAKGVFTSTLFGSNIGYVTHAMRPTASMNIKDATGAYTIALSSSGLVTQVGPTGAVFNEENKYNYDGTLHVPVQCPDDLYIPPRPPDEVEDIRVWTAFGNSLQIKVGADGGYLATGSVPATNRSGFKTFTLDDDTGWRKPPEQVFAGGHEANTSNSVHIHFNSSGSMQYEIAPDYNRSTSIYYSGISGGDLLSDFGLEVKENSYDGTLWIVGRLNTDLSAGSYDVGRPYSHHWLENVKIYADDGVSYLKYTINIVPQKGIYYHTYLWGNENAVFSMGGAVNIADGSLANYPGVVVPPFTGTSPLTMLKSRMQAAGDYANLAKFSDVNGITDGVPHISRDLMANRFEGDITKVTQMIGYPKPTYESKPGKLMWGALKVLAEATGEELDICYTSDVELPISVWFGNMRQTSMDTVAPAAPSGGTFTISIEGSTAIHVFTLKAGDNFDQGIWTDFATATMEIYKPAGGTDGFTYYDNATYDIFKDDTTNYLVPLSSWGIRYKMNESREAERRVWDKERTYFKPSDAIEHGVVRCQPNGSWEDRVNPYQGQYIPDMHISPNNVLGRYKDVLIHTIYTEDSDTLWVEAHSSKESDPYVRMLKNSNTYSDQAYQVHYKSFNFFNSFYSELILRGQSSTGSKFVRMRLDVANRVPGRNGKFNYPLIHAPGNDKYAMIKYFLYKNNAGSAWIEEDIGDNIMTAQAIRWS